MISWIKLNPQTEIAKLTMPVLIVQGTTDLQVKVEQAELLAKANPKAKKVIVDGMNHVLKDSLMDAFLNVQTYNQPDLPLSKGLVEALTDFIQN